VLRLYYGECFSLNNFPSGSLVMVTQHIISQILFLFDDSGPFLGGLTELSVVMFLWHLVGTPQSDCDTPPPHSSAHPR